MNVFKNNKENPESNFVFNWQLMRILLSRQTTAVSLYFIRNSNIVVSLLIKIVRVYECWCGDIYRGI